MSPSQLGHTRHRVAEPHRDTRRLLVTERRDGTRRLYRADPDAIADVRAFLDEYWTSGLERLRDAAEAAQTDQQPTKGRR